MFAPSIMTNDAHSDTDEKANDIHVTATSTKQRQMSRVNVVASWIHAASIFCLAAAAATMLIAFMACTVTAISDIETGMIKSSSMEQHPTVVSHSLQVKTLRRVLSSAPLSANGGAIIAETNNVFDKDEASLEGADAEEESMSCNGLANLCNVPVNEVLFLTLHNAMASADENFFLFPNHNTRLEEALVAGFRGLNLDVGTCNDQVAMYHTFCWLGSRHGETVFQNIATFLNENPHEVLMLTFQLQDNVSLDAVYQSMEAAGLAQSLYVHNPSSTSSWPTLQSLITKHKKRVVLFHYNGENHCNDDDTSMPACPPGMHYWYQYGVNTQFSFDSIDELQNVEYACQLMETPGVSQSTRDFFKVNLFLTIPSQIQSSTLINTLSFAQEQMQKCSSWVGGGAKVSLLVHDFWEEGDLLQLAQTYNKQLLSASERASGGGDNKDQK